MKILLYTILILAASVGILYLTAAILPNNRDGMDGYAQAMLNGLIILTLLIILEFAMAYRYWKRKEQLGKAFLLAAFSTLAVTIYLAINL